MSPEMSPDIGPDPRPHPSLDESAAAGRFAGQQPSTATIATAAADRARIEREIRARYASELAAADICDSLQLEVRIRAEIERTFAAG
jgi:hypothetical protein